MFISIHWEGELVGRPIALNVHRLPFPLPRPIRLFINDKCKLSRRILNCKFLPDISKIANFCAIFLDYSSISHTLLLHVSVIRSGIANLCIILIIIHRFLTLCY